MSQPVCLVEVLSMEYVYGRGGYEIKTRQSADSPSGHALLTPYYLPYVRQERM